jgi:hypothetical protein
MALAFSLAASGSSPDPFVADGPFNINIRGTWVGTWALERSLPGSGVWDNCVLPDGSPSAFTGNGAFAVENVFGQEKYQYRVTFTRTSGTLTGEFTE